MRRTIMELHSPASELVRILFTALNSRDLTSLEQHLAEDAGFDFPGPGLIRGRKKIILFLKILFRKFSRLTFSLQRVIAEQDCACAVWTNEGKDKTGIPYSNRGITLLEIREGKITFLSDYFKDTSFTPGA
jgi:ketosteroid isomerase-like protein